MGVLPETHPLALAKMLMNINTTHWVVFCYTACMQTQNNFNSPQSYTATKNRSKLIGNLALLFFILCFISPFIFALLITAMSSPDAQQYGLIQFIVMGVYNLPAVAIGLIGLVTGLVLSTKNEKISNILSIVSILASLIGIGVMASWFLSAYFY